MAIHTGHGKVPAGKRKLRGVMPSQGIGGGLEGLHRVTTFAAVIPRRARELPLVDVAMAISTLRQLDFVECIQPLWNVTLSTRYRAVFPFQRIGCGGVLGDPKGRRLETLHVMARRALAAVLAGAELPFVRVVLMAIQTFLESDRLVEIPFQVALFTGQPLMLPQQGVLGLRMIELLTDRGLGDLFPTRRGVTGFARDFENSFVGGGVAIDAGAECKAHVPDNLRIVGFRLVALLACNAAVLTREWVVRLRVVKLACGFPIVDGVTLRTVATQLALMPLDMTGNAVARKAQKCAVQVLDFYGGTLGGRYVFGIVTLLAGQPGVLPFQNIPGLVVVESLLRWLPMN